MVNRRLADRGAKAAQNKDKQKDSRHLHNCGLSFLAIRRPSSYLIESAWQGDFSCQAICFASTSINPMRNLPHRCSNSRIWLRRCCRFSYISLEETGFVVARDLTRSGTDTVVLFFDFRDAFYAFQTLLEAPLTRAMAFRVSTMHRAHSPSSW